MRLDLFLVKSKKAISRTQAQDFIENKYVSFKKFDKIVTLTKSSYEVTEEMEAFIQVDQNPLQKFVSRAGLKLEAAIVKAKINIENQIILDVGQSTGGFTECLLSLGAQKVVGVDVGHDQLHQSLKNDSRVIFIEGLNAKELAQSKDFLSHIPRGGFPVIVMDVSFISITKVMNFLKTYLAKDGDFLFLVKPQFEAGAKALDRNGIIKDEKVYALIQNEVTEKAVQVFGEVKDYFKSDLPGKDGNQEFFIYGKNKF
ncbi:MAG: TlyA family RNA methyltransferase [Bdellovibrio sp.]|nr:TlyA family RNA methyltransferase [Bdellovibrio sp.]